MKHHFITRHFVRAFDKYGDMIVSTIYHSNGGWTAILGCKITGQVYKIRIDEILTETEVKDITPESIIKEGGF